MRNIKHNPRRVAWMVGILLFCGMISLLSQSYAQTNVTNRQKQKSTQNPYGRPAPTKPIKPEIPSIDRYISNKVFLERADSLYHHTWAPDRQVVSGNVLFRQGGMFLYCDSAYYYSESNSLDAFGHVKMTSGDTLVANADRLFYDGMQKLARLRNGPSQSQVRVRNRKTTLSADSLFYSVNMERGWYDCGGRLEDDLNVLTSQYGEYSPSLKTADFYGNVVLRSKRNGNRLLTDTLYYNTRSGVASIVSRTYIYGTTDTIVTYKGEYNTRTGNALLQSRSTVSHTDSNGNVTRLTGDHIIYDKATRTSRAYMFDDPMQNPRPMVLTDTAHKVQLIAEYGEYNDLTRSAYATGHPLLREYSRPDTNYLRADTIYTFIESRMTLPPYNREQQQLYDSLMIVQRTLDAEADSIMRVNSEAIAAGDSTLIPKRRNLVAENPLLHRDSVMKEFSTAKAIKHARFFNQQIQGIADTLLFVQYDSMLYMKRRPIVWSDNRQVTGDTIIVHFNDSTSDRARVVNGFVSEHLDEDFYNQLKGKRMFATFVNSTLDHLDVDGNVEVILLPAEKDSTFNKVIRAESEHLALDMNNRELDKLKMWSAVDGTVTPIFKIKRSDQFLPGFYWGEALRPKREWYNNRWVWDDELGDVSDEMIEYFKPADPTEKLEEYFSP